MSEQTQPTTETQAQPSDAARLYTKISLVMAAVENVKKDGHNQHFGYDYATEASIINSIRGALVDQSVIVLPSVDDTAVDTDVTRLSMIFQIIDAETGFAIEKKWVGSAQSKIDKGVYAAMTGAVKYFLLKTFLIPTNDDPENDKGSSRAPRQSANEPDPAITRAQGMRDSRQQSQSGLECQECGGPATLKTGTSKTTGKPWKGLFCDTDRDHVKWMKSDVVSADLERGNEAPATEVEPDGPPF